jgi:hypothetical protein
MIFLTTVAAIAFMGEEVSEVASAVAGSIC